MSLSAPSLELQKKILLWLLAGSCMAALLVLLFYPAEQRKHLHDLAIADSLIHQELALFNVPQNRIRTIEHTVGDHFTRKQYVVDLPVQVSKTHLHAELNKQLRPWQIKTVGHVDVAENEMTLYLVYRDTIIRSIELRTDPDFVRIPHPAELLVYFDRSPTSSQIERLQQINVPVGIVLRSDSRRLLTRWAEELPEALTPVLIWFDDAQTSFEESSMDSPELVRSLEAVTRIQNEVRVLAFAPGENRSTDEANSKRLEELDVPVYPASGIMIITGEDRFEFDRQMLTYSRLARQAAGPRLLVRVSDTTLDWLEEWIPRVQRGGVVFTLS